MAKIGESFNYGVLFQYFSVASMFLSSSIFYFFLAHLLPVASVGAISLLYAVMNIMNSIFMFGLSNGIQHYFSFHLNRGNNLTVTKLIKKTTMLSFILALGAFISTYYLAPFLALTLFHAIYYQEQIRIIGIAVSGMIILNVFASMLLGLNQYQKYSIIYTLVYFLVYFFPLSLVFLFGKAIYLVVGVAIIYIVSALVFIFYLYKSYKKISLENTKYEKEQYRKIIYYSIPLFFSSILLTSATYIDRIIVSYFINLSELGIYNFALVVAGAASLISSPIGALLIPKLSSFFSLENREGFRSSMRILLNITSLIYIPSALGIAALSKPILYVFAGKAYESAYIPLIIIMFMTSFFITASILSSGISSIRKTRIFVLSSGISLASNLILSLILIPKFGITGASISYSSMNAVNFIIVYYYARKFGITNYDISRLLKIWISSMIMFLAIFYMQFYISYNIFTILLLVIAGFIIYFMEIKAFRLISIDEMNYAISVIPDKLSFLKNIMMWLAFHEGNKKYDFMLRNIK